MMQLYQMKPSTTTNKQDSKSAANTNYATALKLPGFKEAISSNIVLYAGKKSNNSHPEGNYDPSNTPRKKRDNTGSQDIGNLVDDSGVVPGGGRDPNSTIDPIDMFDYNLNLN